MRALCLVCVALGALTVALGVPLHPGSASLADGVLLLQSDPTQELDCHLKSDGDSKAMCCAETLDKWRGKQALYKQKEEADTAFLVSDTQDEALQASKDAANEKYEASETRRIYDQALRDCTTSATAYSMPKDDAATVTRETAEEESNAANAAAEGASETAQQALQNQADTESTFQRMSEAVGMDEASRTQAEADKATAEALISEKQSTLDTEQAAVAAAQADFEAKETALIDAKTALEDEQAALSKLNTDRTAKIADFDAQLEGGAGSAVSDAKAAYETSSGDAIATAEIAVGDANDLVSTRITQKGMAETALDAKQEALERIEEELRTAQASLAKANTVLTTSTTLLDNAESRKTVMESEVEEMTEAADQATQEQAFLKTAALQSKARLAGAISGEEGATAADLQAKREQAAANWESNYETLSAKMDDIDSKYDTFQSCIQDGKWICDGPAE